MPTNPGDVAHLLRRTGFGGTTDQIAQLASMDREALVDSILEATGPAVNPPPGTTDPNADNWKVMTQVCLWWIDRMATTPAPLVEKMILFWHGHFVSSFGKVEKIAAMWGQFQTFRTLGMGSYRVLAQAIAIDPAMLYYLDNHQNRKGAANENFARENMELFLLGVNQYTQQDVVDSARAWTGHGLTKDRINYKFNADQHDNEPKTILGITKNWDGPEVIDEFFDGEKQTVLAAHITKKLWVFFAHAAPSAALVEELASAFIASDFNIKALLRAIFVHDDFYSEASNQNHVLSPIEFIAAVLKYTGAKAADAHPEWNFETMGQRPMWPPNVSGWRGYQAWVTTSAMWSKGDFVRRISWKLVEGGFLAEMKGQPVETAVQTVLDAFAIDRASATTIAALTSLIEADRAANGNEQVNAMVLATMTPEFQLG